MFIFYDIQYLCLFRDLNQLELLEKDGLKIWVPDLQLLSYSNIVRQKILDSSKNGNVIKIVDCEGFQAFLNEKKLNQSTLGKGCLYVLYCCLTKSAVLIVDDKRKEVLAVCRNLGINTFSIAEFSKDVIRNEKYHSLISLMAKKMI